jgi:hypothetical protein
MPGFVFSEYDTPESLSVLGNKNSKGSSVFGATASQIAAGATIPVMLNAAGNGFVGANGAALGAVAIAATTLSASSTVSGTGFTNFFAAPPALGTTTPAAVRASNLQAVYTDSSATPGNVTNNSPRGRVALAAAASTIVVTSSLVTATSAVFTQLRAIDGAATAIRNVTTGAGSFTITFNAASTGTAAQVDFLVVN